MKSTMQGMPIYHEEKAMFANDYVSLKNEEYNKKNLKKCHLGDVKRRYKNKKAYSSPDLVGSLINLEFPETRAINLMTADNIITNQSKKIRQTFNKNQREAILDEWARPPSVLVEKHHETPDSRPQTASGYHGLNHTPFQNGPTPRPYSTGMFRSPSRKPPQPSGFMWVKMKQNGRKIKDVSFCRITDEIHKYWENQDKKEKVKRERAKSKQLLQDKSLSAQWLSFAGTDASGVVDAFTGESIDPDQFYSIDGKVGSTVAKQLQSGSKLHISRNGELQSETLRVKEWRHPSEKRDNTDDALRNFQKSSRVESERELNKPACLIPLDWSEQMQQADVKVLEISKPATPPSSKRDLSERHPVVYNKLIHNRNTKPKIQIKLDKYCIRHCSRPKCNIDGRESLGQRITRITVDDLTKDEEDNDAMTMNEYQELLKQKLDSVPVDEGSVTESGRPDLAQRPSPSVENQKLLKQKLDSVPVDEGSVTGSARSDLTQRLSPSVENQMNKEKSVSLSSLGKTSDMSDMTSASLMSRGSPFLSKERVLAVVPSNSRTMVHGAPAVVVRRPSSVSTRNTVVIRPKSEMTRRTDMCTFSSSSRRAQSSTCRRYNFNQPVMPRSAHSPRVKLHQFHHSGVPSINTVPREGEQEYIKISHQIPSPYHPLQGIEMPSLMVDELEDENRSSSPGSMKGSLSSLDIHRGGGENLDSHEDENCDCTEDATRVMSAALSKMSMACEDNKQFISIPTARCSPGGVGSGVQSELDVMRSLQISLSMQRRSSLEDDNFDQFSEKDDLSEFDEFVRTPSPLEEETYLHMEDNQCSNQSGELRIVNADFSQHHPLEDINIIKREDGLLSEDDILSADRSSPSRGEGKRTVTFRENYGEPSTPTTTPLSTPRDHRELFSDTEEGTYPTGTKDAPS